MNERIEREEAPVGYTWGVAEGDRYLRNPEGELKRVSDDAFRLVEALGEGSMTKDDLDGGALRLVEGLEDEEYLRPDAPVVRFVPPDDIPILPQVLAFVVLFGFGIYAAVLEQPELRPTLGLQTTGQMLALGGLVVLSIAIHELGHYVAGRSHLDPSVRIGRVNGVVPAVITDTTGAWLLPRNRRLWISLAGPLAELGWMVVVLAAHYLLFPESLVLGSLVVVIVSHIFFSVNPLIHGDGYWLLLDAFGIVDLRNRGIENLKRYEPTPAAAYVLLSYGFGAFIAVASVLSLAQSAGLLDVPW